MEKKIVEGFVPGKEYAVYFRESMDPVVSVSERLPLTAKCLSITDEYDKNGEKLAVFKIGEKEQEYLVSQSSMTEQVENRVFRVQQETALHPECLLRDSDVSRKRYGLIRSFNVINSPQ